MEPYVLIVLCVAAFGAGFVDAIVGGGGLIQTPLGLVMLPNLPVAAVIGTLKIPSFSGTFFCCHSVFKNDKDGLEIAVRHDGSSSDFSFSGFYSVDLCKQ